MTMLRSFSALIESTTELEWAHAVVAIARAEGFDNVLFAMVPRPDAEIENGFLHSTYSDRWRCKYDQEQMARIDPTVAHCQSKFVPLIWSSETFQSVRQKEMFEEARMFGLTSGVTLPMRGAHGEAGMFCVTVDKQVSSREKRMLARQVERLTVLRDVALETCQPFYAARLKQHQLHLTPREMECLKWLVAGKTSWDMSRILSISEATVNFHVANIREKMGVNSRRMAAIKATRLGIVDPY